MHSLLEIFCVRATSNDYHFWGSTFELPIQIESILSKFYGLLEIQMIWEARLSFLLGDMGIWDKIIILTASIIRLVALTITLTTYSTFLHYAII